MTAQVEQIARDQLHATIMLLPTTDERRVAWLAGDRLSSHWVSSYPTHRVELSATELPGIYTTYLGCESWAVRAYAGRSIPFGKRFGNGTRVMCDAYGHQIGLAALPGAAFTHCHNAISHEHWRILMEAGMRIDIELRHIFTTLIPVAVLVQPGDAPGAVGRCQTRRSTWR